MDVKENFIECDMFSRTSHRDTDLDKRKSYLIRSTVRLQTDDSVGTEGCRRRGGVRRSE